MKPKRQISEAERERRREWGKRQGRINAETRFMREHQRKARRQVSSASCAVNGAKGAAVTIERHGLGTMFEQARQYRLSHPSPLELQVIGILARLKLKYEREFIVCDQRFLTADFRLPEHELVIEVHGAIHDPGKPNYRRRLQNDTLKCELLTQQNRRLLVLHHSEFANLANVIERIRKEVSQ